MNGRLVHFRHVVRQLTGWAFVAILATIVARSAVAGSAEGMEGLVEQGKTDPRLKGYFAPKGFKVRIVTAEPTVVDPAAMAFDDSGNLFVAEWKPADRPIETWETLALPEGGTVRIRRSRKATTDVVKRLKDSDGDGVYESSEVVVDGCEQPTCILPWKNGLYLACLGRLEKWSDEDGDGKFETRAVLADGFAAADRRGLSGITPGVDGWLYLTTGDDDNHVVGSDGSRVDLLRTGGVIRCRFDGSRMTLFASGLRNPYHGLAFDGNSEPFLLDGDQEDGSKFQGVRLVNLVEEGDYGWMLRPGRSEGAVDFDRATSNGERPGRLPVLAKLGRGMPGGMVVYNGVAFPESFRGTLLAADLRRRIVRGFKVEANGGPQVYQSESVLLTADDDQFRPCQVVLGADGAIYVLDHRGRSTEGPASWGEGKSGRLYQLTWQGDGVNPARATKPNNWQRVIQADLNVIVSKFMPLNDFAEADRALRELLDRGPAAVTPCLGWATNTTGSLHSRLIGIQGARQLWSDSVEATMLNLLTDPNPEIRRLAAQALSWEPKSPSYKLVAKLLPHLDDPDGRVVREVALAIGRHAESRPQQAAADLLRWGYAHPKADPTVKDGLLRALERLGEAGVEEVALAIRTRRGAERATAVELFSGLRSAPAVEQLEALVKVPDLNGPERLILIRQFSEMPTPVPIPTQGLAEWVVKHGDVDSALKIAALEACRLGGNPASSLVLAMLDDDDESVRRSATNVAAQTRPPGALDKLTTRLEARSNTSSGERLAIVRALRLAGPKAFAALDAAYLASEDPAFRRVALRSMANADRSRAMPALEAAIAGPDLSLRLESVRILGESAAGSAWLGKAFLNRTLGRAELPMVLAALRRFDGAEARRLLAAIEEDATRGSGALIAADLRPRLEKGADPWDGLGVFFRESSRCSTCHKVEGRGLAFGPSLTLGTSSPSADRLIESILLPSREITPRHESARVTLRDGRVLGGIVASRDTRSLNLRIPDGLEYRIPAESIVETSPDPASLMPATVALDLSPDELADVVAFLQSKTAQMALKHGPKRIDRVLVIGPFATGSDRPSIPIDRVERSRPLVGQDGKTLTWKEQDSTSWGMFNFRGHLASGPGRAYLAIQVRSAKEQVAALRFGVEGTAKVYLNGSKVADVPERDPSDLVRVFDRPKDGCLAALTDLSRLTLRPGSNLILVALDRTSSSDVRAAFEIVSPEPIEYVLPTE